LKTGKKAGPNNRNLTQQETPVECSEMGTVRNDGSHLCFYEPQSSVCKMYGPLFQAMSA